MCYYCYCYHYYYYINVFDILIYDYFTLFSPLKNLFFFVYRGRKQTYNGPSVVSDMVSHVTLFIVQSTNPLKRTKDTKPTVHYFNCCGSQLRLHLFPLITNIENRLQMILFHFVFVKGSVIS